MHSSVSAAIAIGVVLLLVLIAVGIFNIWRRFAGGGGGGGGGGSGEKVDDLKEKVNLAPKDGGKEMESLLQQVVTLSFFTH